MKQGKQVAVGLDEARLERDGKAHSVEPILRPGGARKVYWVDINRFDEKPDKSTWIEMSKVLNQKGFDVRVLTGYRRKRQIHADAKILLFGALDYAFMFRFSILLNMLQWLIRNAKKEDIIILPPPALYIAPLLYSAGLRKLHLDIRTVPVEVRNFKNRIGRIVFWSLPVRLFQRYLAGHSFITERLKGEMEHEFGFKFKDYAIWSSGVNAERFRSAKSARTPSAREPYTLFYHGTLTESRGIDLVIRAVARLEPEERDQMRFVVVGDGAARKRLEEITAESGLQDRVVFKGMMPYERIPQEIAQADCCICPLPSRPEWNVSSPLKVFEYLACGKPMILTPIPAHRDVLEDEKFVVWTRGWEVDDYADAIARAIAQRDEIAHVAAEGVLLACERFDWGIIGQSFAHYLDKTFYRV